MVSTAATTTDTTTTTTTNAVPHVAQRQLPREQCHGACLLLLQFSHGVAHAGRSAACAAAVGQRISPSTRRRRRRRRRRCGGGGGGGSGGGGPPQRLELVALLLPLALQRLHLATHLDAHALQQLGLLRGRQQQRLQLLLALFQLLRQPAVVTGEARRRRRRLRRRRRGGADFAVPGLPGGGELALRVLQRRRQLLANATQRRRLGRGLVRLAPRRFQRQRGGLPRHGVRRSHLLGLQPLHVACVACAVGGEVLRRILRERSSAACTQGSSVWRAEHEGGNE